ncbi:MAG: Hydroxyacylglutathione hydrolase [Hyphomicrobiales bacterium]|nr:Hydroxyacylglutathione hydrolase [Hyphomicrobiales bacterium]
MAAQFHQFTCLEDNYGVLAHDPSTGATASIDAPEAGPVLAALKEKGWTLTHVLVTHHHNDHIGGVAELRANYPAVQVVAPAADRARIPGADLYVNEGDEVRVGAMRALVIATPGHTSGHIVYHMPDEKALFAGDTLFAMGCGRAFEAPGQVLYQSVMKLAGLPGDTQVYCGHEYTMSNGRFAQKVDPDNAALDARMDEVAALRAKGLATVPTNMDLERATNPFLRVDDPGVRRTLGMENASSADVFAELRERKNRG